MNRLIILFVSTITFGCEIEKQTNQNISESDIKSGIVLFQERCVACHGSNGKLGFGGAKDLTTSKKTLSDIILQVTNGKGAMAGYKNILNESEIKFVSEYALSLQK